MHIIVMNKTETVSVATIQFSLDNIEILTSIKNNIYLRGSIDHNEPCVIIISQSLFIKAFKLYLKSKNDLYDVYKHFCGVGGFVNSQDYIQIGTTNLLIDIEIAEPNRGVDELIYNDVPLYKIKSFDEYIDMEHG
jgi:hypothetical protein